MKLLAIIDEWDYT